MAQMIDHPSNSTKFIEVDDFNASGRGEGGFGYTGTLMSEISPTIFRAYDIRGTPIN